MPFKNYFSFRKQECNENLSISSTPNDLDIALSLGKVESLNELLDLVPSFQGDISKLDDEVVSRLDNNGSNGWELFDQNVFRWCFYRGMNNVLLKLLKLDVFKKNNITLTSFDQNKPLLLDHLEQFLHSLQRSSYHFYLVFLVISSAWQKCYRRKLDIYKQLLLYCSTKGLVDLNNLIISASI